MSRNFNGTDQYLEHNAAAVTGYPVTLACWFRSQDADKHQVLISIGDNAVDGNEFALLAGGAIAGDPILAKNKATSTSRTWAISTSGYSLGVWHHACGVFAGPASRAAYIDGGSKGTETTTHSPENLVLTRIGFFAVDVVADQYMDGLIAEAAIWSVALTDAEIKHLASGFSPLTLHSRLRNLVAYWPVYGAGGNEPDYGPRGNRYPMSLVNGPTASSHPPLFTPALRQLWALDAPLEVVTPHKYLRVQTGQLRESDMRYLALVDGVPEPAAVPGYALLYVDETTGELVVKDGDGNTATLSSGL